MTENKQNNHEHDHDHGNLPLVLFFVGLVLFIVAEFMKNVTTQNVLFTLSIITAGYHVMGEGFMDTIKDTKAKKKFSPNVHLLMGLAAIGAMSINDFQEGALLILIFAGAHFLEHYAEDRSQREITNLLKLNPTEGRLILEDGSTKLVSVSELKIGDKLQVNIGDQVPTDGIILKGKSSIDEASITGESMPKDKGKGDFVFGSTINGQGSFVMEVTKNPDETVFAKILKLVSESQSNLSKTATKIKILEPKYVTLVLILFPLYILFGHFILMWSWNDALYRGMVFLTVTSPCALAASDVPATLSAISNLAKQGVLFKGGAYLSNLAEIDAVAFDKTGTLTKGEPIVTDVDFKDGLSDAEKTKYIDLIVAMERQANHPLGDAILNHFKLRDDLSLEVENIIGMGIIAQHKGVTYQIGKPSSFNHTSDSINELAKTHTQEGKTVVYFGTKDEVYTVISMMDVESENAKKMISYLNTQDIQTIMITGDATLTAEAVARNVGIKEVVAEVHPEDKAQIIKDLQTKHGLVTMIGDGVNDAPALVQADIGFAMGGGTDVAIDVADAVLMKNDMCDFAYAHRLSSKLKRIVWQNIAFSMGVVLLLVILNTMGQMSLPLGVVFHEGSTIIVILNGLRLLKPIKKEA
ncbi:MAG TPA: heavy metal translocating P-type ATPase [Erysipelothrix sp.]|nr:heavy metal translocating P-type ATPase [Erysipelothrix sp.]